MEEETCSSSLLLLPDELINAILTHLLPRDLFACQLTCRTLDRLSSESLVWRRLCSVEYRYWHCKHDMTTLLSAPPVSVNWKRLLTLRSRQDRAIEETFKLALGQQAYRVQRAQQILEYGYDAKDALRKQMNCDATRDDGLARRYWASQLLGSIERAQALEHWSRLASGEDVPLERAFGAFDLFVADRPPETLDELSHHFDALVAQFRADDMFADFLDARDVAVKAQVVAQWLSMQGLTGVPSQARFRDLKNALISVVLREQSHPSLPIVSVAIFCCVAQRLGLDARPCGYPLKVLAVIVGNTGQSAGDQSRDPVYLDPSGGSQGIELATLRTQLSAWGIPSVHHPQYLEPASTISMIRRVARNLEESLSESDAYEDALAGPGQESWQTTLHPKRAYYAVVWANILFMPESQGVPSSIQHQQSVIRHVAGLAGPIVDHFPFEMHLLRRYVEPRATQTRIADLLESLELNIAANDKPRGAKMRSELATPPQFQIGQVFKHKRYGYTGVITGWDDECKAGDAWIETMNVHSLSRGSRQPFYNAVGATDETTRYVAEENVKLFRPEELAGMPEGLAMIAGKYFERWDDQTKRFVSNVRDQYPED